MNRFTFDAEGAWGKVEGYLSANGTHSLRQRADFIEGYGFAARNTRPGTSIVEELALLHSTYHGEAEVAQSAHRLLGMVAAVETIRSQQGGKA